jgi:hypothetical protein
MSFEYGLFMHDGRRHQRLGRRGLTHPLRQHRRNLRQREAVIDGDMGQRTGRHARTEGGRRILHDRGSAADLDRHQASGAIVDVAGQDHADGPAAPVQRGAALRNSGSIAGRA